MRQIVLNIKESKFSFFMELIKSLDFVQVQEEDGDSEAYNPEFVEKINESQQQAKEGKVTRVKQDDINSFLGL